MKREPWHGHRIYLVAIGFKEFVQSLHHYQTVELTPQGMLTKNKPLKKMMFKNHLIILRTNMYSRSLTLKSSGNCQKRRLFDRTSLKDFLQALGHSPLRRRAVWQWQYQAQPTSHSPFSRCGDCAIVPRQVH